jgi:hypothetical protein
MTVKVSKQTLLCNATKKLLKRAVKKINEDEKNVYPMMLLIHNYVQIIYNDKKKAGVLQTLAMAGMWNMFEREVRK